MAGRLDEKPNIKNGCLKPNSFLGTSGAEFIEARVLLPIVTPDRFMQTHNKSKSVFDTNQWIRYVTECFVNPLILNNL
ncbi:hypothetical protein KKI95_02545 [Xenorhabdus bovienii]|uniref:hypothetical protein n=1 Tax=Xenorhabdus bovienii TaxID=40576 RepID=UPI0023B31E1E|nr:hypothetical protein [Xenorhabdus bovienii]MDE9434843.1 hypothetical protein [Xenorhabdus bovienii]MDE9496981.1 hypothetical protein [Xenorhabdus bovienii]